MRSMGRGSQESKVSSDGVDFNLTLALENVFT